MNNLIPLHFDRFDVRMILRGNVPWWVLNDVCVVAGFSAPRTVAARLYDWQKDYVGVTDAIGRLRRTLVVNEAGLYGMIIGSNKPEAEAFSRWLFTEVLPSIRQHGFYPPPPPKIEKPVDVISFDKTTQAGRFLAELVRVADHHETDPDDLVSGILSKHQMTAVRQGTFDIENLLSRDRCWLALMSMGFHIPWIIWGVQIMHPDEGTPPDYLRLAGTTALALPER